MQFNYQEALNVIREKQISWVEYFYRNYGIDVSNAITSYQDHLAVVANNIDDNILKLEDYITGIARHIEGAHESLKISIGSNCADMIGKAKKTVEVTVGENGVEPVKFIKDMVDQFNTIKAEGGLIPEIDNHRIKPSMISVLVEHLNVTHGDNTETCFFIETEVLTVFTKTGIVCKGVMYLEPGDILVGRKYVSKVTRVYK